MVGSEKILIQVFYVSHILASDTRVCTYFIKYGKLNSAARIIKASQPSKESLILPFQFRPLKISWYRNMPL